MRMGAFLRQIFDPAASSRGRWLLAFALALPVAAGVRIAGSMHSSAGSRQYAAQIARQIASAADGLVLAAQQKNIPEPAQWAVGYLAQGVEPRLIQITKLTGVPAESLDLEQPGLVELKKPFALVGTDAGSGIRIAVTLPASGFLGTTTDLGADLATLAIFMAAFLVLGLGFSALAAKIAGESLRLSIRSMSQSVDDVRKKSDERHERLVLVLPQLREVMLAMARQLREIFGRFEVIARTTTHAHENIQRARKSHHQAIHQVRKALRSVNDLSGHCVHAEASTLNVMVQAAGQDPRQTILSARLAQQQMAEIRRKQDELQKLLHELERRLEPVAMDLDLSFHSLEETREELNQVPGDLQSAGERMAAQGRAFQSLDQEFPEARPAAAGGYRK